MVSIYSIHGTHMNILYSSQCTLIKVLVLKLSGVMSLKTNEMAQKTECARQMVSTRTIIVLTVSLFLYGFSMRVLCCNQSVNGPGRIAPRCRRAKAQLEDQTITTRYDADNALALWAFVVRINVRKWISSAAAACSQFRRQAAASGEIERVYCTFPNCKYYYTSM